jgi:hypothetical protein
MIMVDQPLEWSNLAQMLRAWSLFVMMEQFGFGKHLKLETYYRATHGAESSCLSFN